jgi:hypothetical protein
MTDYSLFADLLSTFRQSLDIVKALWVLVLGLWVALPCVVATYFIRRYFEAEPTVSVARAFHILIETWKRSKFLSLRIF